MNKTTEKIIVITVVFLLGVSCGVIYGFKQGNLDAQARISPKVEPSGSKGGQKQNGLERKLVRFGDLLDAIEIVESGGDCNAVGDNGRAVGAYQIHLCYMKDADGERMYKRGKYFDHFEPDDRYDRAKSREMIRLYMSRYATYGRLGREPTLEDMARIHNGGLNGWKRESTKPYWEKVKKYLDVEIIK